MQFALGRRRWRREGCDWGTRGGGRRTLPAVVGRPPPLVPPTRFRRLRGLGPPPAVCAGRARVPLPALPHVPGPGGAAAGARSLSALLRPPPCPRPLSPRGLHGRPGATARRLRP